ncbi:putative phage tail protein [compost metagenome]
MQDTQYEIALLRTMELEADTGTTVTGFGPRANYMSTEKVEFFAGTTSGSAASYREYDFYTTSARFGGTVDTGITGVPANYDSDVQGDVVHSNNSPLGTVPSGPAGCMQRRQGAYAAVIGAVNPDVYFRASLNDPIVQFADTDALAVAISSPEEFFVVSASSLDCYSSDGASVTLAYSIPVSLDLAGRGNVRSIYVEGVVWVYGGQAASKIYRITVPAGVVEYVGQLPTGGSSYYGSNFTVSGDVLVRTRDTAHSSSYTMRVDWFNLAALVAVPTNLADVVEAEVALSSLLSAEDVDTSLLTDTVRGYRVQGGSIRSALEPLQGAFPFDVVPSGYQIKCVPRGQSSVATIPWEDLGASDGDTPGDLLQESREMDSQLPALVAVKYLDANREYATGEQSKPRINTQSINRVDRELPIVLTADEAAGVADVLVNLPWLERSEYAFSLPPTYRALEPGDVVTVQMPYASFELRLIEINYGQDGRLECKARPNRAALYSSTAKGGEGVPPSGTIPLSGPTLLLLLDIPVVDETLQNSPGFAAVALGYTDGWPGAVAFRSIDGGQTWTDLQGFNGLPTVGSARGTLPASACTLIDQRTLTIDLITGELESITRDQMLSGVNYAAYGVDGRWEIVRFQNATLQSDGSYLLSGFVRGERGTEWTTGLHQAGDWFVLLDDPDNVFIDMAVGSIGVPATYRGVTSGASIDSASDVPFTYQGVNLECLSPVYAKGSRDGSANFSGAFTRRSRLSSSWWTNGVVAPVGETIEAYEIDVMSGATVKRTITANSPAFTYSAANQTTDFGSPQAAITFRIYQLSSVVGRGYPLEVTL